MEETRETPRTAIVVGSGFGGAVTACRLAQAGFEVVVLERGRRYEAGDFPPLPAEGVLLPDLRRWTWQHDQGLWDVLDLEEVVSVQAAGYGGGSLIYANVHLRPPLSVFAKGWPQQYAAGAVLEEYFDLAGYMLAAEPISAHPDFAERIVKADQLRQAARHLGRGDTAGSLETKGFFYPPLTISYADGENRHGVRQSACKQCGRCSTGCPERAKNSLDFNYLAVAERHGARVRTQCEVTDITELRRGWAVRYYDHKTARRSYLRADHLFLCAGVIHSTRLLARARLRRAARAAKKRVGTGYYPGANALGAVYETHHPQLLARGPTITSCIVHWESAADGSFFMLQDGGVGHALTRMLGLLRAPLWVGRNRLERARSSPPVIAASPLAGGEPWSEQRAAFALPSIVDDLASAIESGALERAVPRQARWAFRRIIRELEEPLLLSAVVRRTIEGALADRFARCRVTRDLDPARAPLKWLMALSRWLIGRLFGSDVELAQRALGVALRGADLPPRELLQRVLGHDATGADHRTMFLAMGRDAKPGVLLYDRETQRQYADLDLYHLAPGYTRQEQLMVDVARTLGGELRVSPAWSFLGKPITVHSQGGCRMSDDPAEGVTDGEGRVHGAAGLYVMDASLFCNSVGVNPSATIVAIAERNVQRFIEKHGFPGWGRRARSPGEREYAEHRAGAADWGRTQRASWHVEPPLVPRVEFQAQPLGLEFREWMQGYYAPTTRPPKDDAEYRARETEGRPDSPLLLALNVGIENLARFFEDEDHEMQVAGDLQLRLPGGSDVGRYSASGYLQLFVPRHKPYGIRAGSEPERLAAQVAAAGSYRTIVSDRLPARDLDRFLRYRLGFEAAPGEHWVIDGKKRIRDDPAFDAWRDTSSLFVELYGPLSAPPDLRAPPDRVELRGAGVVHVDLDTFLHRQLPSFRVTNTTDPARISWALTKFGVFFFGELQRIYAPEVFKAFDALFRARPSNVSSGNRL